MNTKKDLVLKIATQFANPDHTVDWQAALTANPHWRKQLQNEHGDIQPAYNLLNELRREGEAPMPLKGSRMGRPLGKAGNTVLELMQKHADANGYLTPPEMDEFEPGWEKTYNISRIRFNKTVARLRATGHFKKREAVNGFVDAFLRGFGDEAVEGVGGNGFDLRRRGAVGGGSSVAATSHRTHRQTGKFRLRIPCHTLFPQSQSHRRNYRPVRGASHVSTQSRGLSHERASRRPRPLRPATR